MKKLTLSLILLLLTLSTFAVPAYRGWQTKSQPDGTTIQVRLIGDEFHHYWQDQAGNVVKCDSLGYWRVVESQPTPATIKARRQASAMLQSRPQKAVGSVNLAPRGLVILVNFSNSKFAAANTQVAMNDLMNSSSYTHNGATGSVRQFFSDQSDGQYTPEFDVIGPVTLTNNVAHYGGNDAGGDDLLPGDMVVEACSIANASYGVDFTQYDNDGDGEVDFVYIIYAGKGEADGGAEETIWPHNWSLDAARYWNNCSYTTTQSRFDGKYINNYACSGELSGAGARTGIGTIAHEFGHVIGLPDLYDIDYGQNYEDEATPGAWHIMDGGSYNNDGKTPPNYTIYDKYFLGWKTPTNPGTTAQTLTLKAAGTDGYNAYQITTSGNSLLAATSTTTAYYIENRQQSGWDKHLPGHGLVIWKIMYNQSVWNDNAPNATPGTIRYAVVSASGATTGIGTAADPFPGTQRKTEWRGVNGKPLLNITEKNGIISLSYIEEVDESICTYEVAYENATVSSESGEIAKGGTITLTVTPALGYVLTEENIEVEIEGSAKDFTYSGTTLTIPNVTGDVAIYIMPEIDPNYVPIQYIVTWIANGSQFEKVTYNEGAKLVLPTTNPVACSNTKEFVGWTTTNNYTHDTQAPAYVSAGEEVTANATYYAVYALKEAGDANSITVEQTAFTAVEASMDDYISYAAEQGNASTAPAVYDNEIRIYQNGGILNVNAKTGAKITSVTIGSSMTTSVTYKVDAGSESSAQTIAASGKHTVSDINASSVQFICKGTDKNSRLYLNDLEVTYTTGNATTYTYYSTDCSGTIDVRTDPTFSFTTATKVLTIGDTYKNTLTTNSDGTITYTTSDEHVATVASDGTVTAKIAGTVTITASVTSTATHNAASASYSVTVVRKKATPTFSTAQKEIKVQESYTQVVTPNNHNGTISYESSNKSVATVDAATGMVVGMSIGTATITAHLAQSTTYDAASASYEVNVVAGAIDDGKLRVTWIANGEVLTDANATHAYTSGEALKMPSTEVNACSGMEFVGWTAIKDYQNPFCPPTDLFHTAEDKTVTANITYYAVYKTNSTNSTNSTN